MFGGAYAIRPYPGRAFGSLRVPGKIRRRPQTPAPTRVRAFGSLRVSGRLPCPGRGRPQTPGLSYVLIGISVRLHLAFASGFLSVCEGKGLYVRRACQYVILRISSRPCAWPECSFYRRPIYCLSAPYTAHGVPEIREPQTILYVAINTSEVGFFWGGGGKTKAGYTLRKSSTCTRLFAFRVQCLAS